MTLSSDSAVGSAPIAANEFAQTARTSIQVTSRQGDVFRAEVYRCINITRDPQLAQQLISGALYQVADPAGEQPYELALPIRYHDEKKQVFALVLPEELRHQEFKLRAELLQEFSQVQGVLPDYIREFRTIYGVAKLAELGEKSRVSDRDAADERAPEEPATPAPEDVMAGDQLLADGGAPPPRAELDTMAFFEEQGVQAPPPRAELDEAWSKVEQEREQLARERQQLDEVRERI